MSARLLAINNYHYRRGGSDVMFLEQNRLFEASGWAVVPFAMRHPNNLPTPWAAYFVDEIEYGRSYAPLQKLKHAASVIYSREARARLGRLLDVAPPTVAHAHNVYHHLSPSIFPLLKRRGVPVVMTVHDLKLACPAYTMLSGGTICERCRGGRIANVALHRCIKGSLALSTLVLAETAVHRTLGLYAKHVDRFVVPSRFYIDKLVEWGWARDRFVHVPNFVDAEALVPRPDVGDGFVYFGRLSPEKGLETLIRAAAMTRQTVALVGTGPIESSLRALAAEIGADARFLGFRTGTALAEAVGAARAAVLPSTWYENAPVSVMEAYALGRPVIGARIGGIPELIREGVTGATFASGNVEALAVQLARFAAMDKAKIAAMGAAGRAWMRAEFSPSAYLDRLMALYATL